MKRGPTQAYTDEFRAEAVKLVLEQGLTQGEAAKRVSCPKETLNNWVRKAQEGGLKALTGGGKPTGELEAENSRLRKELAQAQMERDILKKATAYFAKESLQGTR